MKKKLSKKKGVLSMLLTLSMIIITVGCSSSSTGLEIVNPESVGLSTEKLAVITSTYQKLIDDKQLPGSVTLVARNGKIAYLSAQGYADIENQVLMRPDTMFRLASVTKAIVNLAAMMEWERGAFKLDDPISKYIPEFKNSQVLIPNSDNTTYTLVPANSEITIWNLFTHTSGLAYGGFDEGSPQLATIYAASGVSNGMAPVNFDNAENVKRIATLPLKFHPGESWAYGHSAAVIARLVEVTSGKSIEQYIREKICLPLGMNDTYFHVPKEKVSRIARPYLVLGANQMIRMDDGVQIVPGFDPAYPYESNTKLESGDGGLVSTVIDYYFFTQMMLNKGQLNGVRILQRETVELMITNQLANVDLSTGGFGVETVYGPTFSGMGWGLGVAVLVDPSRAWTMANAGLFGWAGVWGTSFFADPTADLIMIQMEQTLGLQPGQMAILPLAFDAIKK